MPLVYTDTPNSSAIARVGYDVLTSELRIVFKNKPQYPEYIWGGVTSEMAASFLSSPSKGEFYHAYLKNQKAFRLKRRLGSYRLAAIGRRIVNKVKRIR